MRSTPQRITLDERGWTLLELLAFILIFAILVALLMPAGAKIMERVERVRCSANLRNLAVGAGAYLQDHKQWPQIFAKAGDFRPYAKAWVQTLTPYGISHETWICPTIQKILESPDYKSEEDFRIDYYATPFDDKELTPYLLKGQPWFVEKAGPHGRGNLMIFSDGSVKDLQDFVPAQ